MTRVLICFHAKTQDLLEMLANGQKNVKIASAFFCTNFPLYGN